MLRVKTEKDLAHDVIAELSWEEVQVKQYRYRSAMVINQLFKINRDNELEQVLAKKSGEKMDNHTVYEIRYPDGSTFAIQCSDDFMAIGVGIDERIW